MKRSVWIAAVVLAIMLALIVGSAWAEQLRGNAKWENGYEYNDGTATITVAPDGMTASWATAGCDSITAWCVKVGGPGGGTITCGTPGNAWESDRYAISWIIIWVSTCPT